MSEQHGKTDRPWDPERSQHEAQSPAATLPAGAVVFFGLDTVRRVDVHRFDAPYAQETRGAPPFDPALMGCLWLSADCVGVFSRRTRALAGARPLAFLAMVGQDRPDFRPISACRTRPLEACKDVVVPVVRLAGARGLVRWATSPPMARRGRAMRHGTRRCVLGIGRRPWSVCARRLKPW